jgi:murein DD-endopeptidase MepM/ murein hydrolase activator NlpD
MKRSSILFLALFLLLVIASVNAVPTQVLSPVSGPLYQEGIERQPIQNDMWEFWQHQSTEGHSNGSFGIGGANDYYAWDVNFHPDSDAGLPVYAVASGTVAQTYGGSLNTDGTYGQVLIDHGGWYSGYIHMNNIQVTRGQSVTKDTILGYISHVVPPDVDPVQDHLHFAIYTGTNTHQGLKSVNCVIQERLGAIPTITDQEKQQEETSNAKLISLAIDYKTPIVKNFANQQVQHSSSGVYNIAQICDVWQSIYSQWTYVSAPPNFNYFTSASDSIKNGGKGNCLDYAILNSAVIESIGGSSRVVTACSPNSAACHAYAEVYVGDTLSDAQTASTYIRSRYGNTTIYGHKDSDLLGHTHYWLNLDWDASHPGGRLFVDDGIYQVYFPNGFHESHTDMGYPQ